MRLLQLVGVLFIIGGTALLWKRPTYAVRQDVVQIGDLSASLGQRQPIPPWVGAGAIAVGALLLLSTQRARR